MCHQTVPAGLVQVREALSILSWLEKRSSRRGVQAAKGVLGMQSCQLSVCGGGGGAEQQEHSRIRKSLLCLGQYLHIAVARRM